MKQTKLLSVKIVGFRGGKHKSIHRGEGELYMEVVRMEAVPERGLCTGGGGGGAFHRILKYLNIQ